MVERLAPELLSWASILDEQTRAQAETASGMGDRGQSGQAGSDPGLDGYGELRGDRPGQPGVVELLAHGAGRAYSRSKARKTFSQDDLRAAMVGIEYRDTAAFVDEIPAAYKDIDQVMADAADLVEVRTPCTS